MAGYDADFLGNNISLPLPAFDQALVGNVLENDLLAENIRADYPHYSVITNRHRRSPIFAALNVDQSQMLAVARSDNWRIDSRVGDDFQLDNDYYKGRDNPWDRGHMAMRSNAAWGGSSREAKQASDETFYYTNSCLQHGNLNQDEWLGLETWVADLEIDTNGRVASFSGPIYGDFSRVINPRGRQPAEVPAGFFKIVCFINKATNGLDVRAFIINQDADALAANSRTRGFNFQKYQVTVSEIEEKTGLQFDDRIYQANPLRFTDNEDARDRLNVREFPERIEVDGPHEVIDADHRRIEVADHEVPVFVVAAMVNPKGADRKKEWISILNLSAETIDLTGWQLSDTRRKRLNLEEVLDAKELDLTPGEAVRVNPLKPLQLGNTGGVIELFEAAEGTESGRRIDRVRYTKDDVKENVPVVFACRTHD